jgi:hypothetical protein
VGALALYSFSLNSWLAYRKTKSLMSQMYCVLSLTFATALLFFGLPGLVTGDAHVLRYTYFSADFFVQLSMQIQVWILWFLGLRNRLKLRWLLAITLPLSAVTLGLEVLTSQVSLSQSPPLIIYLDKPPVLVLKSIIYLSIALPLGYFLLRQAPAQTSRRAKLKTATAGLFFIVVCLAATSNNIFDKGSDTVGSAHVVLAFFIIFLLAQLPHSRGPN